MKFDLREIKRKKESRRNKMFNPSTFAIVETIDSSNAKWFQLIHTPTYFILSCGRDLESIKGVVKKYVSKYKTEERLQKAIKHLMQTNVVSSYSKEIAQKNIDLTAYKYREDIEEIVKNTLGENAIKLKNKKELKRKLFNFSEVEKVKEVKEEKEIKPVEIKKLNKKRQVIKSLDEVEVDDSFLSIIQGL